MSEKTFKASSGYEVKEEGGELIVHDKYGVYYTNISEPLGDAFREYFQHQRDQELGRARWPENPDYVIYREPVFDDEDGRSVRVADEQSGRSWRVWENSQNYGDPTPKQMAAADWFFTEGPGKEPERPWEQAQAGEVWRLTIDGEEGNYLVKAGGEGPQYLSGQRDCFVVDRTRITAGRKLLNADGSVVDE